MYCAPVRWLGDEPSTAQLTGRRSKEWCHCELNIFPFPLLFGIKARICAWKKVTSFKYLQIRYFLALKLCNLMTCKENKSDYKIFKQSIIKSTFLKYFTEPKKGHGKINNRFWCLRVNSRCALETNSFPKTSRGTITSLSWWCVKPQ